MAAPITADLRLSPTALGLATSAFYLPAPVPTAFGLATSACYAASALSSGVARRLAGRLATPLAPAPPALVTALGLLAVATAPNGGVLAAALVVAGAANSLAQPAGARLIASRAPARWPPAWSARSEPVSVCPAGW